MPPNLDTGPLSWIDFIVELFQSKMSTYWQRKKFPIDFYTKAVWVIIFLRATSLWQAKPGQQQKKQWVHNFSEYVQQSVCDLSFSDQKTLNITSVESEPCSPFCHLVESPCRQARLNILHLFLETVQWLSYKKKKQSYLDMHTSRTCWGVKAKIKYFSWWYLCAVLPPDNIDYDRQKLISIYHCYIEFTFCSIFKL